MGKMSGLNWIFKSPGQQDLNQDLNQDSTGTNREQCATIPESLKLEAAVLSNSSNN